MKSLKHPGPISNFRFETVAARLDAPLKLRLEPGDDLFGAVDAALNAAEADAGCFTLLGGVLERLTLMTGGAGQDGAVVGFCGPISKAGPLRVLAGAGICGRDLSGARVNHCHAVVRHEDGSLFGGHFMAGEAPAGDSGVELALTAVRGAVFSRREDPETGFTLFHPEVAR